jgi:Flp pilus assembly protein TadB
MDTKALERQLGDLTYCIATSLRAGYTLRQVFEVLASQAPEPAASACKLLLTELTQGRELKSALADWKAQVPSPALARLADQISGHSQEGGNLVDLLDLLGEELLREAGSDPAFYPLMCEQAQALGAKLPQRVKNG